jgi:erythromycin esterase
MFLRRRVVPYLLVAACLCAGAAPVPSSAISGTVVDASGRAVEGARVALVPMGLFDPSGARFVQMKSAADGSFDFEGVGAGRYGVTATAPGRAAAWVADVEAGRTGLRLQLSDGGGRLFGRVVDQRGRPRAGAEVRIVRGLGDNGDVFLLESGADGRWTALVPDGNYSANAVVTSGFASAPRSAPAASPRVHHSVELVLDAVWPPGPPPGAVVDWLRAHEIPLATVEPGRGFADLVPLRAIVGDASAVGLGEATHGTREFFRLKHRMLEYLVAEMGFNVLAIETGLPESFAIEDYVLGGPGDPAQLLAGESAVWKTEELADVLRWMRMWNRTHSRKVHYQGTDMRKGGAGARNVLDYLQRTDPAALSEPFVRAFVPVANPSAYSDVTRRPKPELAALSAQAYELVLWLEGRQAPYVAKSGADAWWRATMQARALAQMFGWLAASDMLGRVLVRESAMADNALRALEHYGPDSRAVVWAHNAHIAGDRGAHPPMMGVHLRRRLGKHYRAIGSAIERGSYQAWDAKTNGLKEFPIGPAAPGSLENTLAAAGRPIAVYELRALPTSGVAADWLRAFQVMRQFDGLFDDERPPGWGSPLAIVARDYDALAFVAVGTTARRLPAPPLESQNTNPTETPKSSRSTRSSVSAQLRQVTVVER